MGGEEYESLWFLQSRVLVRLVETTIKSSSNLYASPVDLVYCLTIPANTTLRSPPSS